LNNELINTQRELARRNSDLIAANLKLDSLATTDGLTGLKNHRVFQESLEREHARSTRYGTPLSLLMLDVDHFKQFNDQFGHPAGDEVLKQVARILASESRSDAAVARYGGEEFAVVMPHCNCEEAASIAERLRRAVEIGPWDLRPVTVSIGVATVIDRSQDRSALIARADAAMYRAKVSGRNQVCSGSDVCSTASALTTS
jgi:diguanylate cyclase (GGDEF)-like protein